MQEDDEGLPFQSSCWHFWALKIQKRSCFSVQERSWVLLASNGCPLLLGESRSCSFFLRTSISSSFFPLNFRFMNSCIFRGLKFSSGSCLVAEKARENEQTSGNYDWLSFEKLIYSLILVKNFSASSTNWNWIWFYTLRSALEPVIFDYPQKNFLFSVLMLNILLDHRKARSLVSLRSPFIHGQ